MIRCKINLDAVLKDRLFKGAKGTYLDITLLDRHGDKYGNDFMVVQDLGKEARLRGEKSPIRGNGKIFHGGGTAPATSEPPRAKPANALNPGEDSDEHVTF